MIITVTTGIIPVVFYAINRLGIGIIYNRQYFLRIRQTGRACFRMKRLMKSWSDLQHLNRKLAGIRSNKNNLLLT